MAAALPQREGGPEPPPTSHAPAVASGGISEGEHRTSKSSFDRIVEKLVPHYPAYSRLDCGISGIWDELGGQRVYELVNVYTRQSICVHQVVNVG